MDTNDAPFKFTKTGEVFVDKVKHRDIINEFQLKKADKSSPSIQIALLTKKIWEWEDLVRIDPSRRKELVQMLVIRRRLLTLMRTHNPNIYLSLLRKLNLKE